MAVFSIDITICATAYIKAGTPEEAYRIASQMNDSSPQILDSDGDVEVSGLSFDDPDLPDLSISPAMTIHGIWPGATVGEMDTCDAGGSAGCPEHDEAVSLCGND